MSTVPLPQYIDPGPFRQFGDRDLHSQGHHLEDMEDVQYEDQDGLPALEDSDDEFEDGDDGDDGDDDDFGAHPLPQPVPGPQPRTRPSQFTPTPRCRPPHKCVLEEPHPDATAGGVLRWEQVSPHSKRVYDPIWENKRLFEHAEWLGNAHVSNGQRERYLRQNHDGLPWTSCRDFLRDVDRLPHGPRWRRRVIPNPNGEMVDFWVRDPIEVIKALFSTRRFARHMRYAPVRHWTSQTREKRLYSEVWTGNRWWRLQNALGTGRGATIGMVILSSDKTQMSLMRGNKQAWPVYLTLGNISKSLRRRPSEHAQVLLGYIPVTDINGPAGWQFYHDCMKSLLHPLKEAGRRGVEMVCADGGVRRVFPLLAGFVGDWPEQCLVACVRQSRCPICCSPKKGRGEGEDQYAKRARGDFLKALERGNQRTLKKLGYRPTQPFWQDFPLADISSAITPDLLHQVNKGIFLDHLVKWMTNIVGARQFDEWLTGIPRASRLRHFTNGKSPISQWTGAEAKSLAQVFMSVASACEDPNAVTAAKHLLNFIHLAHMSQLSERDLASMEESLAGFHQLKEVFVTAGKKEDVDFDDIPKLHMLVHYAETICDLGTTDNFNTEATERLHIEYVKDGWRASNKVEPLGQMTKYLQRREAWVLLRTHLIEIGLLPNRNSLDNIHDILPNDFPFPVEGEDPMDEVQDGGTFEVVRPVRTRKGKGSLIGQALGLGRVSEPGAEVRREWAPGLIWHPKPMVSTASDRSHVRRTGDQLIDEYGAISLLSATRKFLKDRTKTRSGHPLHAGHTFQVWHRCKLEHGRLPFLPADRPFIDTIRATPRLHDEYGRLTRKAAFDTALFVTKPEAQGLHRYSAGRVRAIFKLPRHLQFLYNKKLVYVEHFRPFSAKPADTHGLYSTSHYMASGRVRHATVMPLYRLQMACHLTPRYQSLEPDHPISSSEDLLVTCKIFHLNRYCTHFVFAVLWHWEQCLCDG